MPASGSTIGDGRLQWHQMILGLALATEFSSVKYYFWHIQHCAEPIWRSCDASVKLVLWLEMKGVTPILQQNGCHLEYNYGRAGLQISSNSNAYETAVEFLRIVWALTACNSNEFPTNLVSNTKVTLMVDSGIKMDLSGISNAPACPPPPLKVTLRAAGAAMAVTMPSWRPSASRRGPCSIWSSRKAWMAPSLMNVLSKISCSYGYCLHVAIKQCKIS